MPRKRLIKDKKHVIEDRQRIFVRYTYAILVDLVVLNLFNEYWDRVYIKDFTISLLMAILLQVLLQLTIRFEHRMAEWFKARPGKNTKIIRGFSTWAVLFISKLIILEAIDYAFGKDVLFYGAWHGLIAFIVVVTAIIVAEKSVGAYYRKLA